MSSSRVRCAGRLDDLGGDPQRAQLDGCALMLGGMILSQLWREEMMTTRNIDPKELAKFEALAPIWWNRNGAFKALHDINGLRVGYIDGRAPLSAKKCWMSAAGRDSLGGHGGPGRRGDGIDAERLRWRSRNFI